MMPVTIYDIDTRMAVSRGVGMVCPAGCVEIAGLHDLTLTQLAVYQGDYGDAIYKVIDRIPPRPIDGAHRVWELDTDYKEWRPVMTIAGMRAERWSQIKVERDRAESAPLHVDGNVYDADADSRSRIAGGVQMAMLAPAGWTIDWTLANNAVVTLTAGDVIKVGLALGAQVSVAHAIARQLRGQIDAAETQAEIDAVVWPAGGEHAYA